MAAMGWAMVGALALAWACAQPAASAQEKRETARPLDTGAALCNPDMGWVFHFYDNVPANYGSKLAPSDTVDEYPGLTVVYLRIPWSYVEPEEGKFNWAVVDGPAQRWIAKGKRVAFRFSVSESWMRWATPEWVAKAGAKGYNFTPGKEDPKGPYWEPDYDDPVFLAKLENFIMAAAKRYDGNPEVAFYDVGSFGVWGEGHLWASTQRKYPASTVIKHIGLHLKYFKHTLLAANDDFSFQGDEAIDYARAHGLTLRDDSILVQAGKNAYFHAGMAQGFWPNHPVILESEHYGGSRDRGNWQDGSLYLQSVEDYHASYVSIHWWPREFLTEQRALIDRINKRLGYRLQLVEASWPTSVRAGGSWRFAASWKNAGVAPCYPGGHVIVTLKDAKGGIAGVFVDDAFDVRSLVPAAPGKAEAKAQERTFTLPFNVTSGTYSVFVSVGTVTGTPVIALPLAGDDGQRRYAIGKLTVRGDYAVKAGALEKRGDAWVLPLDWSLPDGLPAGAAPFCHFLRGDEIAFQGNPPNTPADAFTKAGTCPLGVQFTVPTDARGKAFDVKVGLWLPAKIGREDERFLPDPDPGDHRVLLGQLKVAADGGVTFAPK